MNRADAVQCAFRARRRSPNVRASIAWTVGVQPRRGRPARSPGRRCARDARGNQWMGELQQDGAAPPEQGQPLGVDPSRDVCSDESEQRQGTLSLRTGASFLARSVPPVFHSHPATPKERQAERSSLGELPGGRSLVGSGVNICSVRLAVLRSRAVLLRRGRVRRSRAGTQRAMKANVSDAHVGHCGASCTSSQSRHRRAFRSCICSVYAGRVRPWRSSAVGKRVRRRRSPFTIV